MSLTLFKMWFWEKQTESAIVCNDIVLPLEGNIN